MGVLFLLRLGEDLVGDALEVSPKHPTDEVREETLAVASKTRPEVEVLEATMTAEFIRQDFQHILGRRHQHGVFSDVVVRLVDASHEVEDFLQRLVIGFRGEGISRIETDVVLWADFTLRPTPQVIDAVREGEEVSALVHFLGQVLYEVVVGQIVHYAFGEPSIARHTIEGKSRLETLLSGLAFGGLGIGRQVQHRDVFPDYRAEGLPDVVEETGGFSLGV